MPQGSEGGSSKINNGKTKMGSGDAGAGGASSKKTKKSDDTTGTQGRPVKAMKSKPGSSIGKSVASNVIIVKDEVKMTQTTNSVWCMSIIMFGAWPIINSLKNLLGPYSKPEFRFIELPRFHIQDKTW